MQKIHAISKKSKIQNTIQNTVVLHLRRSESYNNVAKSAESFFYQNNEITRNV